MWTEDDDEEGDSCEGPLVVAWLVSVRLMDSALDRNGIHRHHGVVGVHDLTFRAVAEN